MAGLVKFLSTAAAIFAAMVLFAVAMELCFGKKYFECDNEDSPF